MKERFTISMDDDLAAWLDELSNDKIFSSRSHGIEFCVKQIKKMSIERVVLLHWGKEEVEPIFISKNENLTINKVSKKLNVSKDEALKILIYRGLEEMSKDSRDRETRIKGMKKEEKEDEYIEEVIFD